MSKNEALAYIIGVALGDGNLSNPNKRAIRLRITCDAKYPNVAKEIINTLLLLFPKNKVSVIPGRRQTYFNISVYSNKLDEFIPWKCGHGSKVKQQAHIPTWIFSNKKFIKNALKGLIQTDGSVYQDRGYTMINFTSHIELLALDVVYMMESIGFYPKITSTCADSGNSKYTVRLASDVKRFIKEVGVEKK